MSAGAVMLAVAPHALNIYPGVIACFVLFSLWRIADELAPRIIAGRLLVICFAVLGFFVSVWHYGPPLGRDPGVSFLIILLGLKLLEGRRRRDARIALILGYFTIVTHFLYFASLPVVIYLFILVGIITWLLIQLGRCEPAIYRRSDLLAAARLILQAIPYALVLFFLFPRFAGTLWLLQLPSGSAVTGMSNRLSMGTFSNLVQSGEIAFTATFADDKVPPSRLRYWRTSIFWNSDGKNWVRGPELSGGGSAPSSAGQRYTYEIKIGSTKDAWLHALDLPATANAGQRSTDAILRISRKGERSPQRYSVTSIVGFDPYIDEEQRERGTRLAPRVITDRLRSFVDEQIKLASANGELDADRYAQGLLQIIRRQPFRYSLSPPPLRSEFPIDEFIFETQSGFCEHYAASFTTLLRAANIPARLVVGYLGGEHNPKTNEIVVRQADAHAWLEYWGERGWRRLDPTAAIAPQRIESAINLSTSFAENSIVRYLPSDLGALANALRELRWYSALIKQQWQRWFIGFDHLRQQKLLKSLGLERFPITLLASAACLLGLGLLSVIAFWFYRRERIRLSPESVAYARFCTLLARHGLTRAKSEGPLSYLHRATTRFPEQKQLLKEITRLYIDMHFGPAGLQPQALRRMKEKIRALSLRA